MMANLENLLSELCVDEPIAWNRVRLHPLRLRGAADLEYLTLDDSCSKELVTVEEVSAAGSVPELRVRNRAKSRLLIPEGSTLVGAKQNRVVNISVVLPPESETMIPVSCVERGRWRSVSPMFVAGGFADSPLRAKMCRDTTQSLKSAGRVQVDQGQVWKHVDGMLQGSGACSPTAAYHAVYDKWQSELADYEARLRLPDNASGVAVEIGGLLEAVDLFDKPGTLQKLWPRLVRSYLLAALRPGPSAGVQTDVPGFLQRVFSAPGESYEPVGVGTTVRLTNAEAVGAALLCEGKLVHLSVFADAAAQPGSAKEPLPTRVPEPPPVQRPWWRFWA